MPGSGRANAVPFVQYGLLQIGFIVFLFGNFILSALMILSQNDPTEKKLDKDQIKEGDLVLPSLVASVLLNFISLLVIYVLVYRARTVDLVGNLRIKSRTASFKVAFLSWILASIETILRAIAFFRFKGDTLNHPSLAPWWLIVAYHVLVLIQRTFQIYCLYVYEKNTRLTREGEDWLITRKAFLILMAFMNCYFWVLNVAKIEVVVDLTSSKMEEFFSGSIERIIYTINRASTLAYCVESAQLFYKFYIEDNATPLNDQYEDLDEHADYGFQIVETDSGKGKWLGFFMFGVFLSCDVGSFLVRSGIHDVHYAATLSTVAVMVTIFCITLKTTMSDGNTEGGSPEEWVTISDMFEDTTSYLAGEQVSHLRVLLFYSICAASYHSLLTIRLSTRKEMDIFQPVREGCKGVACISLTVFMFWMSHKHRKLRCWRDLNVMFWTVMTLLALDLVEETFEHDNTAKDPLQIYALPLAIDFKTYVIIHTFSDLAEAKTEYRRELRRDIAQSQRTAHVENDSSRATTPSV